MATRVELFAARLGRLNAWLTPRPLQRLQSRWLLERPLAWRTNIAWVSWWSGCAAALSGGLGFTWARYCKEMWTATDLNFAAGSGAVLSGVALSAWVLLILRHSVGELPWRRQLRLTLLHALGVLLLILPGDAFTLAVTWGTAGRVPSDVFAADAALYSNFELGCTDAGTLANPTLAEQFASEDLSRALRAAAERYISIDESHDCGGLRLCWARRNAGLNVNGASVLLSSSTPGVAQRLQQRMSSARSSKELWEKDSGEYFVRYVGCLRLELALALAGGLLLSFVSYPASGRRRSAWCPSLPRWRLAVRRAWTPRFVATAEHRLLLVHPRLWATRLLVFWGSWALVAVLLAALLARGKSDDRFLASLLSSGCLPVSWGLIRRPDTLSPHLRAAWRLIFAGCAALLPGVLVAGVATRLLLEDASAATLSISLFYATAFATTWLAIWLLRSFRGGISAVFGWVWGGGAYVAATVFAMNSQSLAWLLVIPVFGAALLLHWIPSPISPIAERVAGGLLCSVPVSFIALTPLITSISKHASAAVDETAAVALLFACAFGLYVFVTERAIRVLLRAYYQPRSG